MMFRLLLCGFILLILHTLEALPNSKNIVVHERCKYISESWNKLKRVDKTTQVPTRIGLTQLNLDKGHDILMEISHLNSPNYGHHYTADEVVKMFAPSKISEDAVSSWLVSFGIQIKRISRSVNKQWIQFDASIFELEALLHTEYYLYQHVETGEQAFVCNKYHVPAQFKDHVDYITPGIKLFLDKKKTQSSQLPPKVFVSKTEARDTSSGTTPMKNKQRFPLISRLASSESNPCDFAITPTCIRSLYQIPLGNKRAKNNKLGVFESLGDVYNQEDLNHFYSKFAPHIPQGTGPEIRAIDGAMAPTHILFSGVESSVDLQMTQSLIYPQKTVLFQTDDPTYQTNFAYTGFLNTFLDALDGSYCDLIEPNDPPYPNPSNDTRAFKGSLQCGAYKPTNIISISYGNPEIDLPVAYQKRQCAEFMKLGLQGVSIILASGDNGVAAPHEFSDQESCLGTAGEIFNPDFPATCPYVTTVGATFLPVNASVGIAGSSPEIAPERFGSGGGFSNVYPTPVYQSDAVLNFLEKNTPPFKSYQTLENFDFFDKEGVFNAAGRAYPDVSAIGENIVVFNKGMPLRLGGTSASAPIFASILNLINEERLAVGKSPVGFVNPILYANPQMFNDITIGQNPGCDTDGFSAARGWDPVTGLGTPNYPAMLDVFMKA